MINSHFVPQFLLRNFCKDERLQYYDKINKTVERRTTKTVFSEKGYYPDALEKELCHKIETQFAGILNKRIVNEGYRISLTKKEMFICRKFFITSMLRVKDENLDHNIIFKELVKDKLLKDEEKAKKVLAGDFFKSINKVLECENEEDVFELMEQDSNINLFQFVRDMSFSHFVFVRSNNCKEDFVIPDRGWVGYRGPGGVKKLNAMYNMLAIGYDPYVEMLVHMSTPQDYAVFPLSSSMALLAISPALRICLPGMPYKVKYPEETPSLSATLGFGSPETFVMPELKRHKDGTEEYRYIIKQLSRKDVGFLNGLLIKDADRYFGYADEDRIKYSLSECGV